MRTSSFPTLLPALAILAVPAAAQSFDFTIDQAQSDWNWSGTTTIGPIEGNPDTDFELFGTILLDLDAGGSPIGGGQVFSSNALVIPDLHGRIPNPIPWLPPLALIDVTNLSFSFSTPPFTVANNGNFTTDWSVTILSGMLTVTPITGAPTVTDLTGTQGPPATNPGNLDKVGALITLHSDQTSDFHFDDPSSGIGGDFHLEGTLHAAFTCPPRVNYCQTSPNSVGPGAHISTTGSSSITSNNLILHCVGLPPGQYGIYYYGPDRIQIPFGEGFRCVGGGVFRLPIMNSGPAGEFHFQLDHGSLPPGGGIEAGQTVDFQAWYRDPPGGGSGFNLSDAIEVFFCP